MQNMKKKKGKKWKLGESRQKKIHLGDGKDKSLKREMEIKYLQYYFHEACCCCCLVSLLLIISGSQVTTKGNQNRSEFVKTY